MTITDIKIFELKSSVIFDHLGYWYGENTYSNQILTYFLQLPLKIDYFWGNFLQASLQFTKYKILMEEKKGLGLKLS